MYGIAVLAEAPINTFQDTAFGSFKFNLQTLETVWFEQTFLSGTSPLSFKSQA